MKEDKLIPELLDLNDPSDYESSHHDIELDVEIESHYNHFGSRGSVDLVVRETGESDLIATPQVNVYEIKSTHAVKQATGANEILRQFNKQRKYYFKDEDNTPGVVNHFELVFIPTKTTVKHVYENYDIYLNAQQSMPTRGFEKDHEAYIFFRSPRGENNDPAHAIIDSEYTPGIDTPKEWIKNKKDVVSGAADHVAEILEDLALEADE